MVGQRAIQGTSQAYLAILLLLLHSLRQGQALYHTSSEVLHWFSHSAAKHPSVLRCEACTGVCMSGKQWRQSVAVRPSNDASCGDSRGPFKCLYVRCQCCSVCYRHKLQPCYKSTCYATKHCVAAATAGSERSRSTIRGQQCQ